MISVESALRQILEKMRPLPARKLPLLEALGCVLAEDIIAHEPLPPFTNSAMDGYAIHIHDKFVYKVVGDIPAGKYLDRIVAPGEAARIMTGAPLPEGSDAVVPVELVELLSDGSVRIEGPVEPGQHIRPQGEEVKPGEKLFSKGHLLKPSDLGLLASLGHAELSVIPKPRVSVITTGSEVVDASDTPKPGQIRNANLPAIVASVVDAGCPMVYARHVADEPEQLKSIVSDCPGDVLITCGGVSVGDYDFVKTVLSELGEIYFWKVAIKPGKPFVFGRLKAPSPQPSPAGRGRSEATGEGNGPWVFGLPGNPVSGLVAFDVLVRPALRALAGLAPVSETQGEAILSQPISHKPGRREFIRAHVHPNGKGMVARPLVWQGSGMLRSMTEANAYIVVPEESEGSAAGSSVQIKTL